MHLRFVLLALAVVIMTTACASSPTESDAAVEKPVEAAEIGVRVDAAYERGDYATVLRLIRPLADQGDALAQYNLGFMYENGRGVPRDYAEAVTWYRKAAEQGYSAAQLNLGVMYANGWGVPQDYILAHMWFSLAAVQDVETARSYLDSLSTLMTQAQIAEAQRLAAAWQPGTGPTAATPRSGQTALPQPPEEPTIIATGTAFFVSKVGHLLTNAHVVEKCSALRLRSADGAVGKSEVLAISADDLALLKTDMTPDQAVMFRSGGPVRQGESVILYGFPLAGLLTSSGNLTTGTIAGLAGLGDDARLMQISAPVQQGSSGGPVFDQSGLVVGIVVGKLDVLSLAGELQDIPQNVNFAIKSSIATNFLEARGISYLVASRGADRSAADIAESARIVTVQVQCWR